MEIKKYETKYSYDSELDIVNIEFKNEYKHKNSIELEFGVILDFDKNNIPVNLELISASKIVDIEKNI